jgi:hypothetical protein
VGFCETAIDLRVSCKYEDCYLLKTLHGVDEVPAYNVIQLLRLTDVSTLRFVVSVSQRHSVASQNTGILRLHRSENLKNLKKQQESKLALFFSGWKIYLSCFGRSDFGFCLDGRWHSVFFFVIFMSHRTKSRVLSLSSKSSQFPVTSRSVLCKFRSSETVHT